MATGDKILVSGFGDTDINGVYTYSKEFNGYPLYAKTEDIYVCFASSWMPYSDIPSYYIVRVFEYDNSIPIVKPEYRKNGYSPTDTSDSWISLLDQRSGENDVGTVEVFLETSSSSSSSSSSELYSSSSSLSSSSELYSSSSSSELYSSSSSLSSSSELYSSSSSSELYSSSSSSELYSSSSSSELYSSSSSLSSSSELYSSSSSSELYSSSSSSELYSSSSSFLPDKPIDESFPSPAPSPMPNGWETLTYGGGTVDPGSLQFNLPLAGSGTWPKAGVSTINKFSVIPISGPIAWFGSNWFVGGGMDPPRATFALSLTKNITGLSYFYTNQNECMWLSYLLTYGNVNFGQRVGGVNVFTATSPNFPAIFGGNLVLNIGVDISGNCYISVKYDTGGGWVDVWTVGPIGLTWPLSSTNIYPVMILEEHGHAAGPGDTARLDRVRILDTVLSPPPLP